MASTKELRTRIKSISNTAKVTGAMQMIAASKLRKAQNSAEDFNLFSAGYDEINAQISEQDFNHTVKRATRRLRVSANHEDGSKRFRNASLSLTSYM